VRMAEYRSMNDTLQNNPPREPLRDPFYVVKEKVQDLIGKLSVDFDRWKELLETTNTSTSKEFANVQQSVKVAIKKLNIDLNDLSQTTDIVSKNRVRFKEISDVELDSRKKFVNDMKAVVEDCVETLTSDRTLRKIENDKREVLIARDKQTTGFNKEMVREGDDFVDKKQSEQLMVEKKQDLLLDDMSAALARLGDVSDTINLELQSQTKSIEEFHEEIDETQDRMNIVMRKIDKLLKTSDRGRIVCIIFLIVVMIGLLIALIYG